jgi:intraflagellar transport protein 88
MHNIGSLFLKTGELEEACNSYEYIMQEKPDFRAGLSLIRCYQSLGDVDKMKRTFQNLLTIPLNIDLEKYHPVSDVSTVELSDTIPISLAA